MFFICLILFLSSKYFQQFFILLLNFLKVYSIYDFTLLILIKTYQLFFILVLPNYGLKFLYFFLAKHYFIQMHFRYLILEFLVELAL
jgi:hypothetical protein